MGDPLSPTRTLALASALAAAALVAATGGAAAQASGPGDRRSTIQQQPAPGLPIPEPCLDGREPDGDACGTLSDRLDRTDSVIRPPPGLDPEIEIQAPEPTPRTTPVIPPAGIEPQLPDGRSATPLVP